jgi:hypothetical protein
VLDLARKTARYWWLIAVFAVLGGGLSLVFALTRPRIYQSWATLFYQERIQSQLLSPGREEMAQRNIGDRYRELLTARHQLDQIIVDPALDPYPRERDPDVKIDKLRLAVRLETHGANVFRIAFTDSDPERAKRVADKLTKMLQDKDEALRNEQAAATVAFVTDQQENARDELKKRETAYTEFLAKHPEFLQDANSTTAQEGASIRAIRTPKATQGNSKLYALERQRQRIQAALDAPPGVQPASISDAPQPQRIAPEPRCRTRSASSTPSASSGRADQVRDIHPSVLKARERVGPRPSGCATRGLRCARRRYGRPGHDRRGPHQDAEGPAADQAQIAPGSQGRQPPTQRRRTTGWSARGRQRAARAVAERRRRVQSLADSAFRAQMDANQEAREQAAGSRSSTLRSSQRGRPGRARRSSCSPGWCCS